MNVRSKLRPSFADYALMVWDYKLVVVAAVLLALALAALTSTLGAGPLYEATRRIDFRSTSLLGIGDATEMLSPEQVDDARSQQIAEETNDELGVPESAQYFTTLEADAVEGTRSLELKAVGHSPAVGEWLDTYARNYAAHRSDIFIEGIERSLEHNRTMRERVQDRMRELRRDGSEREVERRQDALNSLYSELVGESERKRLELELAENSVQVPGDPQVREMQTSPAWGARLLTAGLAGLLIGAAIALALGTTRPRLRRRDRAEQLLAHPVLADIPRLRGARLDGLQKFNGAQESLRSLRTQLQLYGRALEGEGVKSVVITSPGRREGKSTIAASVAAGYASTGRKTLLVRDGADEGGGPASRGRGIVQTPEGYDSVSLRDLAQGTEGFSLKRLSLQLGPDAQAYEKVVVDAPPVLSSADALMLACEADVVAVVLRSAMTPERKAEQAVTLLRRYRAPVAGTVLNCVPRLRRP